MKANHTEIFLLIRVGMKLSHDLNIYRTSRVWILRVRAMTDLPGHYISNGCQRCWLEAIRFIRYRKKIIATFGKKKNVLTTTTSRERWICLLNSAAYWSLRCVCPQHELCGVAIRFLLKTAPNFCSEKYTPAAARVFNSRLLLLLISWRHGESFILVFWDDQ